MAEQLNYQNTEDARKETGFLRSVFGPSKAVIWTQLAETIGGNFVKGGPWRGDKVTAQTGQWTVTLDTYLQSHGKTATTYTRLRAPYVNAANFRFTIHRAGIFSHIGEMLGFHDIRIGEPMFDDSFVIKATDEKTVRELLADESIRELFSRQPRVWLQVKDDEGWFGAHFPAGVDELYFKTPGVIKDIDRLKGLFELFAAVLQRLCVIGAAYENDPGVQVK